MKILILLLSFVLSPTITEISDYAGSWSYSISTPDGNIKGAMVLKYDNGEYSGTITAYGQSHEMTDIEHEGNNLSFNTTAGGYSSSIEGKFEDDKYVAVISVEGMQIPMTATRDE